MSIAMITRLAAGNALRLALQPAAGASRWRVLRRADSAFTGQGDPDAVLLHEGTERVVVDDQLLNGIDYFFRVYYLVGAVWQASDVVSAQAAASYEDAGVDVAQVLRDRLAAGLKVEVQRGNLTHPDAQIPVLLAPPVFGQVRFPLVTIHVESDADAERFVGDEFAGFGDASSFTEVEGWLASVSLRVIGWSLNADERAELRRAVRRVVQANTTVFDSHGIVNVGLSMSDTEDFESYGEPVYQAVGSFSCKAPEAVQAASSLVGGIEQSFII